MYCSLQQYLIVILNHRSVKSDAGILEFFILKIEKD